MTSILAFAPSARSAPTAKPVNLIVVIVVFQVKMGPFLVVVLKVFVQKMHVYMVFTVEHVNLRAVRIAIPSTLAPA